MIGTVDKEQHGGDAPAIRHVMFDADGVLQEIPGGWAGVALPYLGDRTMEFLHRAYKVELPTLTGQGDLLVLMEPLLAEFGVTASLEELYRDIWLAAVPVPESLDLVRAVRAAGYGVHLGTNQEQNRAAHMRAAFKYDDLFDVSCYSCDLGAAKPDPAFFTEAALRIGAEPSAILFVDDNAENVGGARDAGLAAEQWCLDDGHDALHALLSRHGIQPA
jgi:putative hydrolase of the HAD superfamily